MAIITGLLALALMVAGFFVSITAKTVYHDIVAAIGFGTGAITLAISFVLAKLSGIRGQMEKHHRSALEAVTPPAEAAEASQPSHATEARPSRRR